MIHSVTCENFYSFKDKVKFDFVVDKNSPDTDAYVTDRRGNRISKIMTVIGANASGKSNLLKIIAFLKWFIVDSFANLGPKDIISNNFRPFLFCEEDKASTFEIIFSIDHEIYLYSLQLTPSTVVSESLNIKNKETNHWNNIFKRKTENKKQVFSFNKIDVSSDIEKIVRENSSFISAAKQANNPLAIKIANYFSNIQTNTDSFESMQKNPLESLFSTARFFQEKPSLKEKAEKILRRFDLGLSGFSIEEIKAPDGKAVYLPMTQHKKYDSNSHTSLMMFEESGGTRNLFILLRDILAALDTGDIVVFDELDNNLHPLMVPEIVSLFRSRIHNPKNAQLLFSTHNAQILNELDKAQIVIVQKNEKNVSEIWKLSDIEGVRVDDNYHTKYLAGVYGGIPRFE